MLSVGVVSRPPAGHRASAAVWYVGIGSAAATSGTMDMRNITRKR